MTGKQSRRISQLTGVTFIALVFALMTVTASAQQPESASPPPATDKPARPVILPMTPGAELNPKTAKPATPTHTVKPHIIAVPGGTDASPAPASGLQPERPVKNATNDYTY